LLSIINFEMTQFQEGISDIQKTFPKSSLLSIINFEMTQLQEGISGIQKTLPKVRISQA